MAEDAEELGQIQEQWQGELLFFCSSTHLILHLSSFTILSFTWRLNEKLYKQKQMKTRSTKQRGKNCIHRSRAEYKTRSCKTIKPSTESLLSRSNLEMMKGQRKKFEPWAELWMTQWRQPISIQRFIQPVNRSSVHSVVKYSFFYYYFHLKINWGENVLLIFWGVKKNLKFLLKTLFFSQLYFLFICFQEISLLFMSKIWWERNFLGRLFLLWN